MARRGASFLCTSRARGPDRRRVGSARPSIAAARSSISTYTISTIANTCLGVPGRLYTQGGQGVDARHGYDYVHTSMDYGRGLQVSVVAHWTNVQLPWSARYEARFEHAFLSYNSSAKPTLTIYRQEGQEVPEMPAHDAYYL